MRRLFRVGSDRHDVGKVVFAWHPEGNFLASAGRNGIVQITDRHGDIVDEVPMTSPSPVIALEWDNRGENLAILQDSNGVVPLWSLSNHKLTPLETNLRDPTFLAWSKTDEDPYLAIGTSKGNLLIYDKKRSKKVPVVGKHGKRISCGAWSKGGKKLVLGSDDKSITVSNEMGDTLVHFEVKNVPYQTCFTFQGPSDQSNPADNIISANINGKSIILYNILNEHEDPVELTFPSSGRYGEIVSHQWVDEGLIVVGFSAGYLVLVSANKDKKDMGDERFSARFHSGSFIAMAYNPHLKRIATAGDDGVRVVNLADFKEIKDDFISTDDLENGRISTLAWSPDGQILSISTTAGNVYNFLAKMNVISAKYKNSIAYLSSLREASIVDAAHRSKPIDVPLKLEPSLIALGGRHVAAGMNNRVYYHRIPSDNRGSNNNVSEQEYMSTVKDIQLNDFYTAILVDNKAVLHMIEPNGNGVNNTNSAQGSRTFPSREEGSYGRVTCIALTDDFFYYGTEAGTVEVFYLAEWVTLAGAELRLDKSIKKLFPNPSGTRVVVVDVNNQAFLFNPVTGGGVNQSIIRIENCPTNIVSVIWDAKDKNVILLYDGNSIHTYIYVAMSTKGIHLYKLGPITVSSEGEIEITPEKFELPSGNIPIVSIEGELACQSLAGTISSVVHPFFDHLSDASSNRQRNNRNNQDKSDKKFLSAKFGQALAALKLEVAWVTAVELDRRQYWLALGNKAMELLQVELAIRVYRQLSDAGMVMALQECLQYEDTFLLAGHMQLLFCEYAKAQELFLASTQPSAALDMRRDLLQWDQALKLAQALNSRDVPEICYNYGQQLELRGEVDPALKMYESALNSQDSKGRSICPETIETLSTMGVARCQIRLGNLRQGIRIASDLDDRQLYIDCGDLLEQQKQYSEAATLYLKAQQFEKAAQMYIPHLIKLDKGRINEAIPIMEKVQNDLLNSSFAKLCIAAGRFQDACRAYERAKDMDKVIELKLRNLDDIQSAFDLVRQSSSAQGALLVSEYCQERSDFRGCIEFLLIANKSEEAFKIAQAQGLMDVYTGFLGDHISTEDALKVGHYYEKNQDFGKAGRFYAMCSHYSRALKLFIQCGDREIDAAIDVVGKSQNESLISQLLDFLTGEKDGVPKDFNYIYRMHMALKKYDEAAKTALLIAKQEEEMGNYSLAHSIAVEITQHLENARMKVPMQIRQMFVLLHSYKLVKIMVRHNDHESAARMLLRCAQNLSRFPLHVVPILTSTVIECQRAGMKSSSYEYAAMLMRPEYRQSIEVNLRRKIEAIVRRKSSQNEEISESTSPCPVSGAMIPMTQLECPTTRDALPMCIVTGRHMVLHDWCVCPNSKFPAIYSEYVKYIENELQSQAAGDGSGGSGGSKVAFDPVLGKPIAVTDLSLTSVEDAMKYIQIYNNMIEDKKASADDGNNNNNNNNNSGSYNNENSNENGAVNTSSKSSSKKRSSREKSRSKKSN